MTQNVKAAGEALKHNLKLQPQLYGLTLEMSRYILVKKKTKKKTCRWYAVAKMHSAFATLGKQMTPST